MKINNTRESSARLAFPIYAYYAAQGMFLTRNRRRYVLRLGLLAVVSQLPFVYVLDTVSGNVIVTLLICVLGIYGFTNEGFTPAARWTSLITCAAADHHTDGLWIVCPSLNAHLSIWLQGGPSYGTMRD